MVQGNGRERARKAKERKVGENRGRSKYNRWYRKVKEDGIPGYLRKGWGESRWNRVARFRLENEIGKRKYWNGEGERFCRLCGEGIELWEHVWEECRDWELGEKEIWQKACRWVLGVEGEGKWWMRRLERERQAEGVERGKVKGEKSRGEGERWLRESENGRAYGLVYEEEVEKRVSEKINE